MFSRKLKCAHTEKHEKTSLEPPLGKQYVYKKTFKNSKEPRSK